MILFDLLENNNRSDSGQPLKELAPDPGFDGSSGFPRRPQKFDPGDVVWIAPNPPRYRAHFPNNCPAIVQYSYASRYEGGDDMVYVDVDLDDPDLSAEDRAYWIARAREEADEPHEYSLFVLEKDHIGETSWFPEGDLTLVPAGTDPVALCSRGNAAPYNTLPAQAKKLLSRGLGRSLNEFDQTAAKSKETYADRPIPAKSIIQGYTVFWDPKTKIASITLRGQDPVAALATVRVTSPLYRNFLNKVTRKIDQLDDELSGADESLREGIPGTNKAYHVPELNRSLPGVPTADQEMTRFMNLKQNKPYVQRLIPSPAGYSQVSVDAKMVNTKNGGAIIRGKTVDSKGRTAYTKPWSIIIDRDGNLVRQDLGRLNNTELAAVEFNLVVRNRLMKPNQIAQAVAESRVLGEKRTDLDKEHDRAHSRRPGNDPTSLLNYHGVEPKVRKVLARAHQETPGAQNDIEAIVAHISGIDDINQEQQRQIIALSKKLIQAQDNYNQQEKRFRELTNKLRQQGNQLTPQDVRAAQAAGEIEQNAPVVYENKRKGSKIFDPQDLKIYQEAKKTRDMWHSTSQAGQSENVVVNAQYWMAQDRLDEIKQTFKEKYHMINEDLVEHAMSEASSPAQQAAIAISKKKSSKKHKQINEISRRDFLKGLGATAVAVATPGGVGKLAKAVAEPAISAVTAPAAAATEATLSKLFQTAVYFGWERRDPSAKDGYEKWDDDDGDDEYGDDEVHWDDHYSQVQGKTGSTPYGMDYEALQSPEGNWYLVTSDPGGYRAIVSYIKNGEERAIMLDWDYTAMSYGGVADATNAEDTDLYYDYNGDPDSAENLGPVVDFIINNGGAKTLEPDVKPGETEQVYGKLKSEEHNPLNIGSYDWYHDPEFKHPYNNDQNAIHDIRVTSLAKSLADKFGDISRSATTVKDTGVKDMGPVQQVKPTAALPAPEKSGFDVVPNLKQKEKVPVGAKFNANVPAGQQSAVSGNNEPVENAIMQRIMATRRGLMLKHTVKKVFDTVEQVASQAGPIDTIDSAELDRLVNQVSQNLEDLSEAKATKTRLDPKCWPGKRIGNPKTKVKNGVRVNNCVPK